MPERLTRRLRSDVTVGIVQEADTSVATLESVEQSTAPGSLAIEGKSTDEDTSREDVAMEPDDKAPTCGCVVTNEVITATCEELIRLRNKVSKISSLAADYPFYSKDLSAARDEHEAHVIRAGRGTN